jgi:hypothetical protein
LSHKRKHEVVEIAEALNINEPEAKLSDLRDKIQNHLNLNQTTLSVDPRFKGLYGRRRTWVWNSYNHYFLSSGVLGTNCNTNNGSRLLIISTGSISPDGEVKATVNDTAKKVRKSVSKVFDNTLEVANGVLPESPSM